MRLALALTVAILSCSSHDARAQTFEPDARIAVAIDREQMGFIDSGDTQTRIHASLSNGDPERLRLQTMDFQFSIYAYYPRSQPLLSAQPLTYLRIPRGVLADAGFVASAYSLGPSGGTMTINEIVPLGNYRWIRIRGTFSAEICPDSSAEADLPCRHMTGSFAFNQSDLPDGRAIDGL